MKKYFLTIPILVMIFLFTSFSDADAQRRRDSDRTTQSTRSKRTEKIEKNFADNLWYGADVNLGLSNNQFYIGLNPQIGYKFTDWLSAGPTILLNYSYYKDTYGGIVRNSKSFDYGVGIFARAKFLNQFFFHTEYNNESKEFILVEPNSGIPYSVPGEPEKILTERSSENNLYVGLGYYASFGTQWGYQATLLYDLLEDDSSLSIPISYRIGINYNF